MLTGHYTDVEAKAPGMPGAQATIRWLITRERGAPNFAMRVIEVAGRGERIPLHEHGYEHVHGKEAPSVTSSPETSNQRIAGLRHMAAGASSHGQ